MPAKRKAADDTAASTAPSATGVPAAESDDVAPAIGDGAETAAEPADSAEPAPANRAERRAKGKQQTAAQPAHRGKVVGGKGPAGSQRMWANRRSG